MQDKETQFDLAQLTDGALELLRRGCMEGGGVVADYLANILTSESIRRSRAAAGRPPEDPVLLELPLLKPSAVEVGIADAECTGIKLASALGSRAITQSRDDLLTAVAFIEAVKAQLQRQQAQFDIRLN
jgi:hypothetical protein